MISFFYEIHPYQGLQSTWFYLWMVPEKCTRQVVLLSNLNSSDWMGEFHFGLDQDSPGGIVESKWSRIQGGRRLLIGCQSCTASRLVKVRNAKSD
jgi:hypothetical protein